MVLKKRSPGLTLHEWWLRSGSGDETDGLARYLKGRPLSWATWIGSSGQWRRVMCAHLGIRQSAYDYQTIHKGTWNVDEQWRAALNRPRTYAKLRYHYEERVLPALQRAGVTR